MFIQNNKISNFFSNPHTSLVIMQFNQQQQALEQNALVTSFFKLLSVFGCFIDAPYTVLSIYVSVRVILYKH